jgi:cell division protein FtsQ
MASVATSAHAPAGRDRAADPLTGRSRERVAPVPRDLGAYRPSEPAQTTPVERLSDVQPIYVTSAARPPRGFARRRSALLAAGCTGALLFMGATGFGRHVRHVDALPAGLDRLLVALGLGINEISLAGHQYTQDQDVFRALSAGQATLLTLDVGAARKRVEALPWIESATLVRIFPDKLRVEVRERTPAAIWHDGDRTALVDADGRVLAHVAAAHLPEGLPHIAGAGAPAAAAELRAALARFPTIAPRVVVASRIGERRWDLELSNKSRVKLAAGDTAASLERLVRLEEETRWMDHAGQTVDLTVPKTIAVSTRAPAREPRLPARPAPLKSL